MESLQRWKRVCAIWIGMYPVNVATSWAITMLPWWGDVALPARSAIVVTVVAPLMSLIMMPAVTRILDPWLRLRAAHVRCERELSAALDALTSVSVGCREMSDPAGRGIAEHRASDTARFT